jgi:hypothetical protein
MDHRQNHSNCGGWIHRAEAVVFNYLHERAITISEQLQGFSESARLYTIVTPADVVCATESAVFAMQICGAQVIVDSRLRQRPQPRWLPMINGYKVEMLAARTTIRRGNSSS